MMIVSENLVDTDACATLAGIWIDILVLLALARPSFEPRKSHSTGSHYWSQVDRDVEFELMAAMGFNVMRLGFMWSGFNPAPGVYNQT